MDIDLCRQKVLNLYVVYVAEEFVETVHCLGKVRVLLAGLGILGKRNIGTF